LLDAALLSAMLRCERRAFDEIFDAAFQCVWTHIAREVEKDVRALELTDRVLTHALSTLDPDSPPDSLARWIARWTRKVLEGEQRVADTG
jgi:hypothetical protein